MTFGHSQSYRSTFRDITVKRLTLGLGVEEAPTKLKVWVEQRNKRVRFVLNWTCPV